jgi:hypothetical protein
VSAFCPHPTIIDLGIALTPLQHYTNGFALGSCQFTGSRCMSYTSVPTAEAEEEGGVRSARSLSGRPGPRQATIGVAAAKVIRSP